MNGHGLPEPAMQLWRDYGDLLRRALSPLGAANWQLGGGTVLAKDWHHRRSFDLDITITPTVDSRKTRTAMVAIRDECTRRDLEVDDDVANRLTTKTAPSHGERRHRPQPIVGIGDDGITDKQEGSGTER